MKTQGDGFYIEVADEEGGYYKPDAQNPWMYRLQHLAEVAAELALERFPVVRVCEEKGVFRRGPIQKEDSSDYDADGLGP